MEIKRGDILFADLGQHPGTSIQDGIRPVVVVSNNLANKHSTVLTVVPLTTRIHKKRYLPTHVFVHKEDAVGLEKNSLVLGEQITSIAVKYILRKTGQVNSQVMDRITKAIQVQTGVYEKGALYDSRGI